MIKAPQLLSDLTRLLKFLEQDLLRRIEEGIELKTNLKAEWQAARDADRTAETFETWVDQVITQAGVHWLLSCVFLRFIEDNKLIERPWLSGTPDSGNLALARDRHEAYFRSNPLNSDREYLIECFREAGALPGLQTFFDESHNPVFRLGISGDAAMTVRHFWQQVDPNTGALTHDFTDPTWNTRFLGDLYQDLSEATRKRYALLQTPEFVEEFILDRTLTPAIREFGYQSTSLIDPTCGSGHFLLGAFHRLMDEWQRAEPSHNRRNIAQKVLDAVAGVDLNPFAVAISRFRLLVAALLASDIHLLSEAPNFKINVAIGDSLLHGKRFGLTSTDDMFQGAEHFTDTGLSHAYSSEDLAHVQRILSKQYQAVVGNPPYIVVKDSSLNAAYRSRYASCHRQYSLGVPFTERFFELAVTRRGSEQFPSGSSAGFVGLITANSFMKREFGSKFIEQVLPRLDLTHIVDTSGSYIPGHGTPTVILFGRHQAPVNNTVRTVMGVQGEPGIPNDPALGLVWQAILKQIDFPGVNSLFISVEDIERKELIKHPWSIGGGGVSKIKETIETKSNGKLSKFIDAIGFFQDTHADEIFVQPRQFFNRTGGTEFTRPCVRGEGTRDWKLTFNESILFPYDDQIKQWATVPVNSSLNWLWNYRTTLWSRSVFGGKTYREASRPWWDYHQFPKDRARAEKLIAFASIATHNHFVFDLKGKVFNRSAPVIKLPTAASEDEHLGLVGLLNSSVNCFWMKQVCFPKDGQGQMWEERFEFNCSNIADFPVLDVRPVAITKQLERLAREHAESLPSSLLARAESNSLKIPTREALDISRSKARKLFQEMVALQEELDWHCYRLYKLLPAGVSVEDVEYSAPVDVELGERAFEIALARRVAAGKETTNWFERHGSTPTTEIPARWPEPYRQVVQRRIELIERDPTFLLLEQPLYKRRWNSPKWADLEQAALRDWLLARLESQVLWVSSSDQPPQLNTTSRLADTVHRDPEFMQIAALYAGHADFDVAQLVASLVTTESVPFLPALRYSDSGLRKRAQWEDTWALQRREDKGESISSIPVPPKYKKEDFLRVTFWDLRGGLDVPKERWVSYPGCERGSDGSLPIAWAGWNHLQQATALAAYYLEMKESEGWEVTRLQPLLAGLLELVPWLEQWHNDVDPVYGERMGSYYKGFVAEEARAQGFTLDDLRAWKPAATAAKRRLKKATA